MSVTPSNDALYVALRSFIISIVPGVEVVQGLGNGVPMPEAEFICMTATAQRRLATNHSVDDGGANLRTVKMPTEYSIQVDCYGPNSSDYATALKALWRDPYGCDALAAVGAPLYATDPIQVALINGEENYEQRWTFTALLQFNPVVTVPQQHADVLNLEIVSVDAEFPPSP